MQEKVILYAIKLLSGLPLTLIQGMGTLVGWGFNLIPNRERRKARININLCFPAESSRKRNTLVRRALVENAKTLLEMPGVFMGEPEH
jgi:KDO2-lipid IV(A) lauroyltransferase